MDEELSDQGLLSDLPLWADEAAKQILESVCQKHQIPVEVIAELVILQRERQHQEKARGINPRFEEILRSIE